MLSSIHMAHCASSLQKAKAPELSSCQMLRWQLACCAAGLLQSWLTPVTCPLKLEGARVNVSLRCVQLPFKFESPR